MTTQGHPASDQVETALYRLVSSGTAKGIKAHREDGVVRPLLPLWREETEAYCRAEGIVFRLDSSNPDTVRGLIRSQSPPLLQRLPPGGGVRAVRDYDTLLLEGEVIWGPWKLSSPLRGLEVPARRPGDRLAGRRKK